jgi:hypothetical protein
MSAIRKTAALLAALLVSGAAWAGQSQWQKNHPRRTEVNKRLDNQNKRINQGVQNGTLSKGQARQLRQNDKGVRQEERDMAAQNGGHITKQEQRTLNAQENQNSRKIYQEKHPQTAP